MRRLLLATVSAVALGLGAAGMACAAGNMNSNAGTGAGSNMPNAAGTTQPGYNSGAPAGSTMPSMTGTSQWGAGGHMTRQDQVMAVQQKLQADNLYSGKIDGRMGRETRKALRDYQQQSGLRATARLDRQTLDSILGNGTTGQGSSMPPGTGTMPRTQAAPPRQSNTTR